MFTLRNYEKFVKDTNQAISYLRSQLGGASGDALTTNPLSQFAATTSAQLRSVISDETGNGLAYFQGGNLGTPSSGVLTNATGTASGLTAGLVTNGVYTTTFNGLGDARYSLLGHNHTLDGLSNLTITSKATGDLLKWNGSAWINFVPTYLTSYTETDPIYLASSWFSTTNNATNWNTAYTDRNKWDGGATGLTASTGRASLGLIIGTDVQAYNANIVFTNQANTYTAGSKQTVVANATNAGFSFGGVTANPSSLITGDFWYRSDENKLRYYDGTTVRAVVGEALAQTLTNKTIDSSSNTITNITNSNLSGTAGITNANLANSTISGISLGSSLAALTATDTTLTFSGSYSGGTARTVGINLANSNVWTPNGAVSAPGATFNGTWYSGGSATTTKPYFLIETTGATSTAWNTSGTGLGLNAASGFAGSLLEFQLNGATRLTLTSAGGLTSASFMSAGGGFRSNSTFTPVNAQTMLIGYTSATNHSSANTFLIDMAAGSMTQTSGTNGGLYVHPTYNQASGTAANTDLKINRTETALGSGAQLLFDAQVGGSSVFNIDNKGKITQTATNTATGTTGNQTINKPSGTVNIAATGTTVTVTNSLVTTASIILPVIRTNDTTATIKNVVPSSGSFVITLTAAANAEVSIGFLVLN